MVIDIVLLALLLVVLLEQFFSKKSSIQKIEDIKLQIKKLDSMCINLVEDNNADNEAKKYQKENLVLQKQIEKLNNENADLKQKHIKSEYDKSCTKQKINNTCIEPDGKDLGFAKEIILLRDNLSMRETLLRESNEPLASNAYKLINLSYKETLGILKRMRISVVDEVGKFNEELQSITDTKPTSDKSQHDTIAETFREGYRTKDKIIRPQEVIIYQYKQ